MIARRKTQPTVEAHDMQVFFRMSLLFLLAAVAAAGGSVWAAFDPASAYREANEVAARYPDPSVSYATPAFAPGKADFTSQNEMMAYLRQLAERAPSMRLDAQARSQQGRELPVLFFSHDQQAIGSGAKPVALIIGQQHGNEPAGGEAALALAQRLGEGDLAGLLDAIDVIIVPRANPDGADAFRRTLANGIDANRDHTLQRTPEIRAIGALFNRYKPGLVLDCHEFTVGGRWVEKVGGLQRIDAMIQYATAPNLPPSLSQAEAELFLPAILAAFDANGLTHDWYHTTDGSRPVSPVAMGGIGPDTGRNVAGLRNAVSFLLETRGVGLGRAHFARRVHTHVVAAEAILKLAAANPGAFMALTQKAAAEASSSTGPLVIVARQRPEKREMTFVDPLTGSDKPVSVAWLSSLQIDPTLTRPRPAGYLLSGAAREAIDVLARAGIATRVVTKTARIEAVRYRVDAIAAGAKEDGRGDDTGAGAIVKGTYSLENETVSIVPGDIYIPLDQALAGLVAALLEPESDAGLVANRLVPAEQGGVLQISRLSQPPD
jgi:predicted deacylase